MNAAEINARLDDQFTFDSKYIGYVFNDCEIIGYKNSTKQFMLQCTKCGVKFTRNRATVLLNKVKCDCSKIRQVRHTDGYGDTKLKSIYMNMLDRCYNERNHAFTEYGGRGIKVCNLWKDDFRNFYNWSIKSGYENGLTLDRINNNGNYAPENCRWVDRKTQANNRRSNVIIIFEGESLTISQLAERLGVNYQTLYSKIKRGNFNNECNRNK